MSALTCTIPISTLRIVPFNLQWGSSVYAKIVAANAYGNSLTSSQGNGAVLLTVPDVPLSFINVATITSASQIGLSWVQGTNNGGSVVIDY